ncbi:hypothetical protein [Streptomyces iakyrus]|uniref:hypothetical protein n=1 Tax=Streptomyces iakyrus TaxID=68219 RepID=UPI0036C7DE41
MAKASPATKESRPYYNAGYRLRSLGPKLAFRADLREKLSEQGLSASPPEPDVLVQHLLSGDHLVFECKTTSFGFESSTTDQARKLLISCANADTAVGVAGEAYVVYVLTKEDCDRQTEALVQVAAELSSAGFHTSPYGTLGLSIDEKGLWAELQLSVESDKEHVTNVLGPVLITPDASGDSRPIYLIPFDPTTEENQDPDERRYCHRMLLERFYVAGVQAIGTADVPDLLVIKADDLFRKATYGYSDKWQARELSGLKSRLIQGMAKVLNKRALKGAVTATTTSVEIRLRHEEDRDAAINLLLKANSEQLAINNMSGQIEMETSE